MQNLHGLRVEAVQKLHEKMDAIFSLPHLILVKYDNSFYNSLLCEIRATVALILLSVWLVHYRCV